MKTIPTMDLNTCARYLREHGLSISNTILADGIEQKVFPFGICIRDDDDEDEIRTFKIFTRLVDEWIAEREVEVEA